MKPQLTLVLCLAVFAASAQQTPTEGLKKRITYDLEEISYHKVPNDVAVESLSQMDLLLTEVNTMKKHVDRKVWSDGHFESSTDYLNPEEIFKEWPQMIVRIEQDSAGMRSYRKDGSLSTVIDADSVYSVQYAEMRQVLLENTTTEMSQLAVPSADDIASLEASGAVVEYMDGGAMSISQENTEVLIDPLNLYIVRSKYEGGKLAERKLESYTRTIENILVPKTTRTERRIIRPSGACMEEVLVQNYTNYTIQRGDLEERSLVSNQSESILRIFPNPTTESVVISIPDEAKGSVAIRISDTLGKQMYRQHQVSAGSGIHVPVAHWPDGLYHVSWQQEGQVFTASFVKKS